MYEIKEYRGHIRNWNKLLDELGVDRDSLIPDEKTGVPDREKRELAIIEKGYEKWGYEIADHLYGMFAFAIYDNDKEELFCVRDQFGTKPFYYYITEDGGLLYGTYIRQIMNQEGFKKELNEDMLQIYLTLTYAAGEDTFFKGVKKLLPGRYLVWKKGEKPRITRYWKPEFKPDEGKSLDEFADEIHDTLQKIMPETLDETERAESFLSGGVDSSYVLAMSKADAADACGYEDERLDESVLAGKTAELLNVKFNRRIVEPDEYFAAVPYVMENMELPLADASAIVFAIGCKTVAEHAKICYSGEGSDEFFGGYNMYRNAERYGENLKTFYVGNTNIMKEDMKQRILKKYDPSNLPINIVKDIYTGLEGLDPLSKMSDVDIEIWLEGDIYLNVDKMSTAAGLEIRMPLTDRRIFDVASRMPSKYKVTEEQNKVAFRKAAAKVLPEEIAYRKKLGFVVPIRYWMADDRYNADVRARLTGETAEKFFHVDELKKLWDEYVTENSDLWRVIYTIYTFIVWYDIYFENPANPGSKRTK